MRPNVRIHGLAAALAACTLTIAATAFAAPAVLSGGATVEDFKQLKEQSRHHSLQLLFVAKGSGANLADVDVNIRALPSRSTVLEHRTEGPMMLATLPPGRYEVVADYQDVLPGTATRQTRTIQVPHSGTARIVMQFATADIVSPERERVAP